MTRVQIEKAAKNYIDDFLNDHIDYDAVNYEEDNYEAGRNNALCEFGVDIFKDGAAWRINSVWHNSKNGSSRCKYYLKKKMVVFGSIKYLQKVKCWAGKDGLISKT